jgi:hypothetical protein
LLVKPKTTGLIVLWLNILTLYIVLRYEIAEETKRNVMTTDLNAVQENIEQTLKTVTLRHSRWH